MIYQIQLRSQKDINVNFKISAEHSRLNKFITQKQLKIGWNNLYFEKNDHDLNEIIFEAKNDNSLEQLMNISIIKIHLSDN